MHGACPITGNAFIILSTVDIHHACACPLGGRSGFAALPDPAPCMGAGRYRATHKRPLAYRRGALLGGGLRYVVFHYP